ncbi:putative endopeptidase p60 [Collinsella sp. AK_207A]|uniref:C40 family peptidase n=1 Tax=Collinsella sp. AK_207A TaxID=2650472 RepID=UPI001260DAFF|nr:C40 family peptidase [Collinsella sp. AK_207A]VWL96006.1 putative endopeptidase p60 [Collinsella sp. AK_207A]
MKLKRTNAVLALGLAATIALSSFPVSAQADPTSSELQQRVNEAYAQLLDYSQQAEVAGNQLEQVKSDLASVQDQIAQTKQEIADKQAELEQDQKALSSRLSSSYKRGDASLLGVVLGSSDFGELFSNLFYANKVAARDRDAIDTVRTAKQELTDQQTALEQQEAEKKQLVAEQEQKTAAVQQRASQMQSYYQGLDSDLQAALANEAAVQAAQDALTKQQAQEAGSNSGATNSGNASSNTGSNSNANTNTNTNTNAGSNSNPSSKPSQNTGSSSSGNTNSGSAPSGILAFAQSKIGCAYSYGGVGPSAYDCSGLVYAAYKNAGLSIARTADAQYRQVAAAGHLVKDVSSLKPGDLVFFYPGIGHVGVYEGNGSFVHASTYGVGVIRSSLYSAYYASAFQGGGSPY